MKIQKGDMFYADLDGIGSEQKGIRPVIIIQNDVGNKHSPTVIVVAMTKVTNKIKKKSRKQSTHAEIMCEKQSIVLCEQVRTIDKRRLQNYIGKLTEEEIIKVNEALRISMAL